MEKRRIAVSLSLLGVGVLFLILGVVNGETAIVLRKAVSICLECIGIG